MSTQAERTAQAWTRTCLAVVGLVLWSFHLEVEEGGAAILLAVLVLLAGAAFSLLAQHRSTMLRAVDEPPPLRRSTVRAMAVAVVAIDVAGLALALTV